MTPGALRKSASRGRCYPPVLLLTSLLVGGCQGGDSPVAPESGGTDSADLDPRVVPIISVIDELIGDSVLVGAEVLVIEGEETLLHYAPGWLDRERGIRMRRNSIFRLYSNTKPILGTAILMLRDRGRLSLSDSVAEYLDAFDTDASRGITIHHLITHTSGLDKEAAWYDHSSLGDLANAIGAQGPVFPVGQRFLYSNQGSAVLTAVLSKAAGMPAENFIQDSVLTPLGMRDTFCGLADDDPRRSRVSSTYAWDGEGVYKYWDNQSPQAEKYFLGYKGIYSTVTDYLRFMRMWVDEGRYGSSQLLSHSTVREALTPTELSIAAGIPYGFHWDVLGPGEPLPSFAHPGFAGTYAWADPEEELLVAFFTQCVGCPGGWPRIVEVVEDAFY